MLDETLLLRQVHPLFIQQGAISSQVFRPTPKDENLLSAYDGDKIKPQDAFEHYTRQLRQESCGVVAVSCQECKEAGVTARPDPEPFPEHCVIDFSAYGSNARKKIGARLKQKAMERGWLYQQ